MSTRKRFSVHELVPQRIYTTDARSRDTRLSAEVGGYNPGMLGRAWQGYSESQLDAMDDAAVARAVVDTMANCKAYVNKRRARGRDGDYGQNNSMGPGAAGSLATDRPEMEFNVGAGALPEDINSANRFFWDNCNRAVTGDTARPDLSTRATPASLMQAHAKHWAALSGGPKGQHTLPTAARRVRPSQQTTPADVNEMNARFWGSPSREQPFNRPWGRG